MNIYKQFSTGYFVVILFLASMFCISCDEEHTKISNDSIIVLDVFDQNNKQISELAGDGETLLKLQARIAPEADDKYRKVIFKISKGQFMSTASGTQFEKIVDNNGIAEVYVKVPLDSGPLYLSAEIGSDSDKYISEKQIKLIDPGQIIKLEILDQNSTPISGEIKADATTILTLKATVDLNADAIGSIKFSASGGTFLGVNNESNTVVIKNKVAIIQYKVSKSVGELYLQASASTKSNIFLNKTMLLSRAFADHLILEPNTLSIDSADDQVQVKTYLTRDIGKVSTGTAVYYKAFQADANGIEFEVGRFTGLAEATTNDNGQITSVSFVSDTGDVDFNKSIIIRVSTKNDKNEMISQSVTLNKK
ncbi:hypothetical protein [Flavobacterium sp. Root420]|uniref:hypothetical protein n=1 Tax=Flavobacterium sp. Root420 TaxID=1736533 RepID=UPI0006F5FD62|nr:hypothetical protein [Flavobacterium sp. Root420]KQX00775.1 hypothetical protein ASC72_07890 [Flavobacterium sp. Root420]